MNAPTLLRPNIGGDGVVTVTLAVERGEEIDVGLLDDDVLEEMRQGEVGSAVSSSTEAFRLSGLAVAAAALVISI